MKLIKIFFVLFLALTFSTNIFAEAAKSDVKRPSGSPFVKQKPAEKDRPKQKITTPQLKLTQEEEGRVSADSLPAKDQEEIPFEPKPIKTKTRLELILDASGSMNGLMDQTTKMAILKSAVNDILTGPLPEGAEREIALRVYGSQKASAENDCKDTTLITPIGKFEPKEFRTKVDSITALGVTPIGYALEEALNDFKADPNFDNVIILVTDGTDSCNAPLCEIAEKLHNDQRKIMINVVGFDLDKKSETALRCVAKNSDGQFVLARNDKELRSALDQVLMANIPYNLRVQVVSGATPLPSTLIVYKAGTKRKLREDKSSGIKFYQLPPGTYDIEVIYTDSKEKPLPSKLIKNVEVQTTSKTEQTVQFNLAMLTVMATDKDGKPLASKYDIKKKEDPSVRVSLDGPAGPYTVWLTSGTYTVDVSSINSEGLLLTATATDLKLEKGKSTTHAFEFQAGTIKLIGTDFRGEPVPLAFRVTPASDDAKTILKGKAPAEGRDIDLPPGEYNIFYHMTVEGMEDFQEQKIESIKVAGGDTIEKSVKIPTGTLQLKATDEKNKDIETIFIIKPVTSKKDGLEMTFVDKTIELTLPAGEYNVKALFQTADFSPPPSLSWSNLTVAKDQTLEKIAVFKYGIMELLGQNAKNAPLTTDFYIYKVGTEELVANINSVDKKTEVKLTEGYYDIKAENMTSRSSPKPNVWFHNIQVQADDPVEVDAIFTNGLLKMVCRGPNNTILECDYQVFTYGMDSPVFKGTTTDKWTEFDIPPGNFYIEAGYHDEQNEVLLKKWITFRVTDNEIVEQVIRY